MDHPENKIEEKLEERYQGGARRMQCMRNGPTSGSGRLWTGLFILLIGLAALLKSFLPLPNWLFTWQMLVISIGIFIGIRHNFRGGVWFILVLVGGIFLLNEFFSNIVDSRFIWPIALIVFGLFLILKPHRRNWHWRDNKEGEIKQDALIHFDEHVNDGEDFLDSTSVFGGIKKNVISKNFKGGEVVNILGGAEINLSQADIQGRVALEVTQIFGGTMLIVPPHWDVKPEMAAIFGGIEDKRRMQNSVVDTNKVLILRGASIFGGIEVKSL